MPSTPSPNLRLNLQETGENINTWGLRLNESLLLIEDSLTKVLVKPLMGNVTLSTALYAPDESRSAALVFTDGGLTANPTVTIPAVSKIYYAENRGTAFGISFTAGNLVGVLPAGRRGFVLCNGTDVWVFDPVALSDNARIAAQAAQALSERWASQLVDPVAGGGYSAREHASGVTVPTGSAMEWAVTVGAPVAGGEFAAKEYALGDLTATGGSAKSWAVDDASPDGSGLLSARSYSGQAGTAATNAGSAASSAASQAGLAGARAGYSQEWANRAEDSPVSTAAGGDGSTTFSARHWSLKAAASAASVDGPALQAAIASKLDKTSAKLDPAGSLFKGPSAGNSNAGVRGVTNLATYRGTGDVTGAIVFLSPASVDPRQIMHQLQVQGFLYNPPTMIDLAINGYLFDPTLVGGSGAPYFALTGANSLGTITPLIRWARAANGRTALILGDVGTVWSFPAISITSALLSASVTDPYCTGWTSELVTDLSAYTTLTGVTVIQSVATKVSALQADARAYTTNLHYGS